MKTNTRIRLLLNPHELRKLNSYMILENWQFELLFQKHCIELSSYTIHWEDESRKAAEAFVYGLQAFRKVDNLPCIAGIFIRFKYRVYQVHDITQASELVELLKKEDKLDRLRTERWKIESIKKKEKSVIKQLKAA